MGDGPDRRDRSDKEQRMASKQCAAVVERWRWLTVPAADHGRTPRDSACRWTTGTPSRIRPTGRGLASLRMTAHVREAATRTGSLPIPSSSAGSCWRTVTAWSARRMTPRTWCRNVPSGLAFLRWLPGPSASIRTWLYKIATNVCLTALDAPDPGAALGPDRSLRRTRSPAESRRRARSRGWNPCRTDGSPRPPTIRPRR